MCHRAKRGSVVNRDPLEERGGWALYDYLEHGTYNPFHASGLEESSFLTEWKQSQDKLLRNTSLPHSNEEIQFTSRRNSTLAEGVEKDKKYYSANAEKGRNQGGSGGLEFDSLPVFGGLPSAGNLDTNLYIFVGNNPLNSVDPLGLQEDAYDVVKGASELIPYDVNDKAYIKSEYGWTKGNDVFPDTSKTNGLFKKDQTVSFGHKQKNGNIEFTRETVTKEKNTEIQISGGKSPKYGHKKTTIGEWAPDIPGSLDEVSAARLNPPDVPDSVFRIIRDLQITTETVNVDISTGEKSTVSSTSRDETIFVSRTDGYRYQRGKGDFYKPGTNREIQDIDKEAFEKDEQHGDHDND